MKVHTTITKNPGTAVYVYSDSFKGHEFVSVREFFMNEDEQWRPTKRGITLPIDNDEPVSELINGLVQARTYLFPHSEPIIDSDGVVDD